MLKTFFIVVALSVFCSTINGQEIAKTEASWERYAFQERTFSAVLPKLPVRLGENNYEHSEETVRFGAYSNGVAYVVSYSQEAKDNPLKKFQPVEPFSEQNFKIRLEKIRAEFKAIKDKNDESESTSNGWQVVQFAGDKTIYKLYFNPKKNNWIELLAVRPNDSRTEADNFIASLKIEKKSQGKEVGDGANKVIGDSQPSGDYEIAGAAAPFKNPEKSSDTPKNHSESPNSAPGIEITNLRIVLKGRANYTEEARKNMIAGTVRVRATFSSTGEVTSVQPISGLAYGLTEQAMAAARRILFVPEKRNGQRISLNRTIEYNFSLY